MKGIIQYLKPYWYLLLLAPLCMLLEVTMDLQQPQLMSQIVDSGVGAGDMNVIWTTGRSMLIVALIGLLGGAGCSTFSSMAAMGFAADLRVALFKKAESFSLAQADAMSTGSLVTRLTNDVNVLADMVMTFTRMLIRAPLLLIGGIVMLLTLNARLTIPLLCAAPLLVIVIVWHLKRVRPRFTQLQERIDGINAIMQENLTGMRVVKAFTLEGYENDRFIRGNRALTDTGLDIGRVMATLNPLLTLVQNAALIVILYIAVSEASVGMLRVGQVMAVVNYATQILFSLIMVSFILMNVSRAQVSLQRVGEVLAVQSDIPDGSHDAPPAAGSVRFDNVTFRYPGAGGDPVLKNITLDIRPGERVAFLGATGAGKTTLVNLIPRFYDVTEGAVYVDGRDVRLYARAALRAGIGLVQQEVRLFSGTIMDNLRWGDLNASDEEARAAARIAQADGFITAWGEGYATPVTQGGVSLSGGQKQRMAIARALLRKPRVLILDDATSAVDLVTEARLQEALKSTMGGMTVLIIAQRIATVMSADRIVVIERGSIAAVGTHSELLKDSELYRDIYESQMGEGAVLNAG